MSDVSWTKSFYELQRRKHEKSPAWDKSLGKIAENHTRGEENRYDGESKRRTYLWKPKKH